MTSSRLFGRRTHSRLLTVRRSVDRLSVTMLTAVVLLLPAALQGQGNEQASREIDAFWAEMSRTVAEGDAAAYARLYHPDAVLVTPGGTVAIADALAGWNQGFLDTAAGRMAAGVDFRITHRRAGATTAHDTGIFRYFSRPAGGQEQIFQVHFEALLVKKDGRWLMTMENQQDPASDEEWEAARGGN